MYTFLSRDVFMYEDEEMCESVVLEEPYILEFVLFRCKIQEICKRAVERYPWLLDFVSNEYMIQIICGKKNCFRGAICIEICL